VARRFRFPLQTLLRVRRIREREAKRKLAAKRAEIARLDRLDEATRAEIVAGQQELLDNQKRSALDPRDLARTWAWIGHLRRTLAERQSLRAKMTAEFERLQAEFMELRKQARIIEKLRERRWNEYRDERRRTEQAASDEVAQQLHQRNGQQSAFSGQLSES
jgi:flagellar protein FliJ